MSEPSIPFPPEFPVLETERLILRAPTAADEDAVFELYSDPLVAEFDDFEPYADRARAAGYAERVAEGYRRGEVVRWSIYLRSGGPMLGSCGLDGFDGENLRAELGYDLLRRAWNRGYAAEAVAAVVRFGFAALGLHRVEAFVTPGNEGSCRVLEKNGFVREGLLRGRDFFKGRYWDGICYGLLSTDL